MDSSGFVGRHREQTALAEHVRQLASGRGQTVLVSGEPGIGKTRLLGSAAAIATESGVDVVWGRASEVGGAPALWPWVEVLAGVVAARSAEVVRDSAGAGLPLVARLVPGLGTDAAGTSDSESLSARFQMFEAVSATLRALAPLVIILDDMHAADQASLLLLEHASRALARARVLIIASFRPEDAELVPEVARVLWRIAHAATHLPLGRLAGGDAATLLDTELGRAASETERDYVLAAAEGSPLFVLEYARLIRAHGGVSDKLPTGVRHAIGARLERLPAPTRDALARASVLGRDLPRHFLSALDIAPTALEPALTAGLLVERNADVKSFSHVLIRETLYRTLPAARAATLHLTAADALAAASRPGTEIVHHLLMAGAEVAESRLVSAAVAAAQELVQMLAFDDAVDLVTRVMAARSFGELARAELLVQLGSARIRAGQTAEGQQACLDAADVCRRLRAADLFARAAIYYGIVFTPGLVDDRLVALLEEADGLAISDIGLAGRIKARLAAARQPAAVPEEQVALALAAVALVRESGDRGALRDVLASATSALAYFAEPDVRRTLDQELLTLSEAAGDRVLALRALARLVFDEVDSGRRAPAEAWLARYEALASMMVEERYVVPGKLIRAMLAWTSGERVLADRLSREAEAAIAMNRGIAWAHHLYSRTSRGLCEHDLAMLDRERPQLEHIYASSAWTVDRECALVALIAIAARRGEHARVKTLLTRLPTDSWAECQEMTTMAWLAEPLVLVGELERAEQVYRRLSRYGHRHHSGGNAIIIYDGPFAFPLGRLAAGLGRNEEAIGWFQRAAAGCRAFDAPLILARVLVEHAELCSRIGMLVDAQALASEALALATRHGVADVAARAEAVLGSDRPALVAADHVASTRLSMHRDGDVWHIRWRGCAARLKDSRGMQMLAALVTEPERELPATLLDGQAGVDGGVEMLDQTALRAYRERLVELRAALAEAESNGDFQRATQYREEHDALTTELARGVGLGGRARSQSGAERARINVQRRLKDAVTRIGQTLPELGRHLEAALRTGTMCVYRPPP